MSEKSICSQEYNQSFKYKLKLELCRSFSQLGLCPYGSLCIFAHGLEQLSMYQPVLKVKKCRNFHTNGYCKFGQRCNFKHDKKILERKKKNKYKFHRIFHQYPDIILTSFSSTKSLQQSFISSINSSVISDKSQA